MLAYTTFDYISNKQMVVIPHKAIGMAEPVKSIAHHTQQFDESKPIEIIQVNICTCVAAREDMIQRAFVFNS